MNFDSRIKIGDIFIERRFNWYMYFAGPLFPKTLLKWSNGKRPNWLSIHNGVFGILNDREGVFESERCGINFRFIEWGELKKRLDKKTSEFKALRHLKLTDEQRAAINQFLAERVGHIRYDIKMFLGLIVSGILRRPIFHAQNPEKWICTEVVSESYKNVGTDLFQNEMPSPYIIEKLAVQGTI